MLLMTQQMEPALVKEPTTGMSTASIVAVLAALLALHDKEDSVPQQVERDQIESWE
jgi:hypothetical protein